MFRNGVVTVSVLAAGLVSVGMFGAMLFIPLFIQIVIGSSATKSGAVSTPMMLAMVASSTVSGQLMTRRGKYRGIAIFGVTMTGVGLLLMALMGPETSYGTVVRNMVCMGIGLGATMPVFTLAVQNAVDIRFVGAATSTVQFFRSMGGALGAAVFGSILANRYSPMLLSALPADVKAQLPARMLGAIQNPQALMNPEAAGAMQQDLAGFGAQAGEMGQVLKGAMRLALAGALHEVFLTATCVLAVAVVIVLRLRDVPLRSSNRTTSKEAAAPMPMAE
jgi:MFS family permease